MLTRRHAIAAVFTTGLASGASWVQPSWAQDWPQRPVTLVQGFGAGGNADSISRVMANALSSELGQQVVVEAKPGAGGNWPLKLFRALSRMVIRSCC